MTASKTSFTVFVPFVLFSLLSAWFAAGAEKPNFIIINCDDLGYADIGPSGDPSKNRTPNLDRMAAEGRVFTDFYSTCGVCSPSRSSLMTGCYPKRIGLHQNETGRWVLFPGNSRGLNTEEVTIAELLKQQGYATGIVGKWHLGDQKEFLPTNHGFDSYFGIPFSNDMGQLDRPRGMYPPLPLLRDLEVIEEEPDQHYITQRYTEEALKFIDKNRAGPFFLYFPHTMPHWPQYSSPDFAGKSDNGKWGDTVEEIDWSTGEIFAKLKDLGIDGDTLVLFTSDNGGATNHGANNAPLRGSKGSTLEGGQRVCMVVRWPGKIPSGTKCSELSSTIDLLPTFVKLAGGASPRDRIIDGHDIWPLMAGEKGVVTPHEAFYYYKLGTLQCVRSGDWKLHVAHTEKGRGKNAKNREVKAQLYNLKDDIGESKNVIADRPEVVVKLEKLAEKIRKDIGDDAIGRKVQGANNRAPGHVEGAVTLTGKR